VESNDDDENLFKNHQSACLSIHATCLRKIKTLKREFDRIYFCQNNANAFVREETPENLENED
jgi:hypothetical protein